MTRPDPGEAATRVQYGRRSRFRFVQTPQWAVLMPALSDAGYRVYSLLLAHANQEAGDGVVWPSQAALAEALGKSEKTVSRIISTELKPLGLVDVDTYRYGQNNTRRGNVYTVHEEPPQGWQGLASVVEFHAARKAAREAASQESAAQAGDPKNGLSGPRAFGASGGRGPAASGSPESAAVTRRTSNNTNDDLAPLGRASAPDARRAPTGSSPLTSRAGSAASAKASIPKTSPARARRLSKEQAGAIRVVEAGFPQGLRELLPSHRPAVLRDAILTALADRTAEQLAQRVARRWLTHGYAEARFGGKGIASPVGVAVALVRAPAECPDLSCEDGVIVGSEEPCKACQGRRADRRATRAVRPAHQNQAGPTPASGPPVPASKWWCRGDCGFNSYTDPPADGMCRECREDLGSSATDSVQDEASIRQILEAVLLR